MAGCLRLSGENNTETETRQAPDPTTRSGLQSTPDTQPTADTPEASTDPTEEPAEDTDPPYPTGLSEDGITEFLYPTHLRALRAETFRANWTKLDRTTSTFREQREYAVGVGAARGNWTRVRGGGVDIYRQGDDAFWRERVGSGYTYGNDQDGYTIEQLVWSIELEPLLTVADWGQPSRVTDSRPAIWEVTADSIATATPVPGYYANARVASLSTAALRIDEDGIIRSFDAEYQVDKGSDGDTITYGSQFEITGLDADISATEPSWLGTARAQAPTVSAAYADDRTVVEVTVDAGNRLEPGTTLVVFSEQDNSNRFEVELSDPLESGETASLYTTDDSGGVVNGAIARGELPTGVSPVRLATARGVTARRRKTTYFHPVAVQ